MSQPRSKFGAQRLATGITLHYVEQGDPSGEPVIFLHGLSDSWFSYSPVLPLLPPQLHAYALSMRGHGDSERPESGYDTSDFAADVVAFMNAQGLAKATVVGHSLGSFVTQRVVLDHPERVIRLVLIGTAATLVNEATGALGEVFRALTDPVPPDFVRGFQESTIYHPVPRDFLETVVAESLKLPAHVWRETWAGFSAVDHTARLAFANVPALILFGDQDGVFSRGNQEHLAATLPQAALKIYPETGHALHWERPERFAEDLVAFMGVAATRRQEALR